MSGLNVLAIDTATEAVGIGVDTKRDDGRIELLASRCEIAPRRANTVLLDWALETLAEAGLTIRDLHGVVVGRGPGSFTGVRIGVATAKGLAHGLGVPLWGVSTLDAVAWQAAAAGHEGALGVIGDAMRGEVYPALFEVGGGSARRLTPDRVAKPEDVAREWGALDAGALLVTGNALSKYTAVFEAVLGPDMQALTEEFWYPDGEGLLAAWSADVRAFGLTAGDPATVLPVYTRLSDAEEAERARAGLSAQAPDATGVAGEEIALTMRAMRPRDLPQVIAIEHESFSDSWSESMFAEELTAPDRAWMVALDRAGEVVGYGGIAVLAEEAHVMNLAVREDLRRRGVGARVLTRLRELAAGMRAAAVTLEVRAGNAAAIALYESAGFESAGVRPRYYNDTGEDAVIMFGAVLQPDVEFELPVPTQSLGSEDRFLLAIESSCDETAAAVVRIGDGALVSNVVASQVDFHARFGGVVPEIASRKHTEAIVGVVDEALTRACAATSPPPAENTACPLPFSALDGIAVTYGPGLVGALVVGLAYAKGLSAATGVPLVGVNHLEGHIFANVLADPDVKPPLVALLVSGGHTSLVHMPEWGVYRTLGETLDDAAGEAFDKVAKVLGLGYPGGPVLSKLAEEGDPAAIDFPRAMMRSGDYSFSLSGLKTAVINHIRHEREADREIDLADLAASFQQAVIDVQVAKAVRAVTETGATSFCLGGGVAANSALRDALRAAIEPLGVHVSVPPLHLCTDNAAMIAAAALPHLARGEFLRLDADAVPGLRLDTDHG